MRTLSSIMQPLLSLSESVEVDANSTACKCADWIGALKCTLENTAACSSSTANYNFIHYSLAHKIIDLNQE